MSIETYDISKETYVMSIETYNMSKETYDMSKEAHNMSNEYYNTSKGIGVALDAQLADVSFSQCAEGPGMEGGGSSSFSSEMSSCPSSPHTLVRCSVISVCCSVLQCGVGVLQCGFVVFVIAAYPGLLQ